jgi:hypothetical protein
VAFWIEIESRGRKERVDLGLGEGAAQVWQPPGPGQAVEGYFLWTRGAADDAGLELWTVAHRRDLVQAETSGVQVSNPLGQVSASRSQEHRQSGTTSFSRQVQVWDGRKPGSFGSSESSSVPSPLPAGGEVSLKTTREERYDDPFRKVARDAGTLGLLGSAPGGGPLLAACAAASAEAGRAGDAHTIRLMCRVVPVKAKPAGDAPQAK